MDQSIIREMAIVLRFLIVFLFVGCPAPVEETGTPCVDGDGDGFTDCEECDDQDPNTFPGAEERCDGRDNNCDGVITFEGNDGEECRICDEQELFFLTQISDNLEGAIRDETDGVACSYSAATRYMFTALDKKSGQVECVYTGRKVSVASDKPDPDDMNTEHTWPQSQGASGLPAKCDLHHLFPTDSDANEARGALPLDNVSSNTDWNQGGSKRGLNSRGDEVFEPRDAHKGNAARALLYFSVRYGYPLADEQMNTIVEWHSGDPPDEAEQNRSAEIGRRQGNYNPFVFCPMLVERLDSESP